SKVCKCVGDASIAAAEIEHPSRGRCSVGREQSRQLSTKDREQVIVSTGGLCVGPLVAGNLGRGDHSGFLAFINTCRPRQSASMSVRSKHAKACSGVSTTGSFSLKLVFSTNPIPDLRLNAEMRRWYSGLLSRSTVCMRPVPS